MAPYGQADCDNTTPTSEGVRIVTHIHEMYLPTCSKILPNQLLADSR